MTLSSVLITIAAGFLPQAPAAPAPAVDTAPLKLIETLGREPRIVGTQGYERGLAAIEAALREAGVDFSRGLRRSGRVIPTRSDALFFEDSNQAAPFAGVRERWNPGAVPTMPMPMAFEHNPASARVRAPIIHLGAGLPEDFQRVAGLGVSAEGCIVLASVPLAPAARTTSVRAIVDRAAEVGAVGVLIAPELGAPPAAPAERAQLHQLFVRENTIGETPLALPTMPLRTLESDALLERLRIKRVRGENGRAVPTRLGPGPVEVEISVNCPVVVVEAPELICGAAAGDPDLEVRAVPLNEVWERPLGGAFELTAELLALTKGFELADPEGARPVQVVFGAFTVPERSALLGAEPALLDPNRRRPARSTHLPGRWGPSPAPLDALGPDWSSKVDAARAFVAYESRQLPVPESVASPLLRP